MSSYQELIKNFERVRAYMRDFYIYGFKSREEYGRKSARSYDDERRRMESWLGEHMHFVRTSEGKSLFISIDSRTTPHNPLYRAWKAKSFTDGDITLHFILFDILYTPTVSLTLAELTERIDRDYLSHFEGVPLFDESTVRKKLKEYVELGLLLSEKEGKRVRYRRTDETPIDALADSLDFFSEVAPVGVIGSFLLDRLDGAESVFGFKHHYITDALDSNVMAILFSAMRQKAWVRLKNYARSRDRESEQVLLPLRILISVQNGRQHLLACTADGKNIRSYRLDYLSDVRIGEPSPFFDAARERLELLQTHMWGVNCRSERAALESVSFTVSIGADEDYILHRLEREKRIGTVERLDDSHYRFSAEVYDSNEMLPWIRTFICRITDLRFSNRTVESRFKNDLALMYRMYGMEGGVSDDLQ